MSYNLQYIFIHLLQNMHHFHSTTIMGEGDTTQPKQTKYNLKQNPLKALLK